MNAKISYYRLRILIIIGVAFLTQSCNKLLDVNPGEYTLTSGGFYKNKAELNDALRGVYSFLASGDLYGSVMLGRMGLDADEGYINNSVDRGTIGYYDASTADTKILFYWRAVYAAINNANAILAQVDNPEIEIDKAERDNIKGQALFLRGYYYFMLLTKFGEVPLVKKPTSSSGSMDVYLPRTSLKTIYESIVEDMEQASALVYDINNVESSGRVSKSVVWGMLARVCLHMAGEPLKDLSKYNEAAKYAKMVIDTKYHELNPSYKQVFVNYAQDKYDPKESIWEVEFYGDGKGVYKNIYGTVGRTNGIKYAGTDGLSFGYSVGVTYTTEWLYNLYEANDLRRDWAIAPFRYVNDQKEYWTASANKLQRNAGKFRREEEILLPRNPSSTPQNFPLLRYSDVLLMYAEAINESEGNPENALKYINQVRRRAKGIAVEGGNTSADLPSGIPYSDFKTEIKNERARELCFELLRRDDLMRWGMFYNSMKIRLSQIPSGTSGYLVQARLYFGNVSLRDIRWPIPSYEMGINNQLEQNTGW